MTEQPIVDQAVVRARQLLGRNATPGGIQAATPGPDAIARRYHRIFGRDHAICVPGLLLSGDERQRQAARGGLEALARQQATNGQIPKYVDPERGEADFWYLGCIDATLWWLIALKLHDRVVPGGRLAGELEGPVLKALNWLSCQEHPILRLVQQNEASDWADIMPRSGFVLYSNALWYRVKELYGLPGLEETAYHFNHLFYPFSRELPDYKRLRLLTHYVRAADDRLYLSFVNFSFWGDEGDVFGNLLAVLFGLARHGPANRIVDALLGDGIDDPWPVRAVCRPITEESPLWRTYMARHQQNLAWQYHNGGAWPFIGGFWVLALQMLGRFEEAERALKRLAEANAAADWRFSEWLNGQDGEPAGMAGQSWNAAMYLTAHHAVTTGESPLG